MTVFFITHAVYLDHLTGRGHPERPERLTAVLDGAKAAKVADGLVGLAPTPANRADIERVHPAAFADRLQAFCEAGGGRIDADTTAGARSWDAAILAAGAGLTAIEALSDPLNTASAAFCAVRPPGHHATATQSMGFCLLSNVAVAAAALADRGERVAIVDYDAHHGNGTQAVFYDDPRVLYVSLHQWPLYPGSGRAADVGGPGARGATLNVPLPPGSAGVAYRMAIDELVMPVIAQFSPTWLIISAGFDGHRYDPITDLGLSSGDFATMTARLCSTVLPGRVIVMLEGGYDLGALSMSTAAVLAALEGIEFLPEPETTDSTGSEAVSRVGRERAAALAA